MHSKQVYVSYLNIIHYSSRKIEITLFPFTKKNEEILENKIKLTFSYSGTELTTKSILKGVNKQIFAAKGKKNSDNDLGRKTRSTIFLLHSLKSCSLGFIQADIFSVFLTLLGIVMPCLGISKPFSSRLLFSGNLFGLFSYDITVNTTREWITQSSAIIRSLIHLYLQVLIKCRKKTIREPRSTFSAYSIPFVNDCSRTMSKSSRASKTWTKYERRLGSRRKECSSYIWAVIGQEDNWAGSRWRRCSLEVMRSKIATSCIGSVQARAEGKCKWFTWHKDK